MHKAELTRRSQRYAVLVSFAIAAAAPAAVTAQQSPIRFTLGQGFTYDSNVLRLSSGAPLAPNQEGRSDLISTTRAGVLFDAPVGLQVFRASAELNHNLFRRIKELDHTGYDVLGSWLWKIGRQFDGEIRYTAGRALTPFRDFRPSFGGGVQRSLTDDQAFLASGNFWFLPDWAIGAGVGRRQTDYSAAILRSANYEEDFAEILLKYRTPAGVESYLRYRRLEGNHPDRNLSSVAPPATVSYEKFDQDEAALGTTLQVTPASRIEGFVGYTWRRPQRPGVRPGVQVRDESFSGPTGRIGYLWETSPATSIRVTAWRSLEPVASEAVDYNVVQGLLVQPGWNVTARVKLEGRLEYQRRRQQGGSGATVLINDKLLYYGLIGSYQILNPLELTLSLLREERDANVAAATYNANIVFLGGKLTF